MPASIPVGQAGRFEPPLSLLRTLADARRVVVFTGAGASAESGISTFRSGSTGLWSRFDPQSLATPQAFQARPALVWGWYEWRRAAILRAAPNPGHRAVVGLAKHFDSFDVVTQNVDDLHERAGSTGVVHLHGRLEQARCFRCATPYVRPPGIPEIPDDGAEIEPPRCQQCAGYVRPGVVWFGESLPEAEWQRAMQLANQCDVLFSIGTSALVYPAAELPKSVTARGAVVIQINPDATGLDAFCTFNLRGPAGVILPAVADALEQYYASSRKG